MAGSPERLTATAIAGLSTALPHWRLVDGDTAIQRELKFRNFRQAFDFMTEIAAEADAADHHPDWSNSYNRVSICLTTHSVGGLSERDIRLAEAIDAAAIRLGATTT